MGQFNLIELVWRVLPADVSLDELQVYGKHSWWQDKPFLALAYALRKSPRINWTAYLENNPDVKDAQIDPVLHFLKHGMFEGRRLYSLPPNAPVSRSAVQVPKITVIVPNYNNSIFLENCLNSLCGQTLQDIEILVIDDGSTDDSVEKIRTFMAKDERISLIIHEQNKSLHMARKTGVAAARGVYIMFCDPDDSFVNDACEKAYAAIARGYDVAVFRANVMCYGVLSDTEKKQTMARFNSHPAAIIKGRDITHALFIDRSINISFCLKIGLASIYKDAFASLQDGYFENWEDLYEMLAVAHRLRSVIVTEDTLYNYTYGVGGSFFDGSAAKCQRFMKMGIILDPIRKYCLAYGLSHLIPYFMRRIFDSSADALFTDIPQQFVKIWIDQLVQQFGALYTTIRIKQLYHGAWGKVAPHISLLASPEANPPRQIGIMLKNWDQMNHHLTLLCEALRNTGHHLSFFVSCQSSEISEIFPDCDIYRIDFSDSSADGIDDHLRSLYAVLEKANIDLMIFPYLDDEYFIWQILLMRLMNIRIIGLHTGDTNAGLSWRGRHYTHYNHLYILRCVDKIICPTLQSEIYFRTHEINADHIPFPDMVSFASLAPESLRSHTIAVMGNFAAFGARPKEALRVLQKIRQICPDARMLFIGHFEYLGPENSFYACARELEVADAIEVTGKLKSPVERLKDCRVLFSGAFLGGLDCGIAEARAMGIPAVIYDVPIPEHYSGVIRVEQGDSNAAAELLCRILMDEDTRNMAARQMAEAPVPMTFEEFSQKLELALASSCKFSHPHAYTPADYQELIRRMGYYAGRPVPVD